VLSISLKMSQKEKNKKYIHYNVMNQFAHGRILAILRSTSFGAVPKLLGWLTVSFLASWLQDQKTCEMQMKYAPALRAKLQISEECERQLLLAM